MKKAITERIRENPVIAAVRSWEDLEIAVDSPVSTIFLLHSDLFSASRLVSFAHRHNKLALIHMDFIEGLGRDEKAVHYVGRVICPDGVISTRAAAIKLLRELGLFTVQRFFLVDSQSFETSVKSIGSVNPDMVEVLPGIIPRVISRLSRIVSQPVIAGGMIDSGSDVEDALQAGAIGVSTGKKELWGSMLRNN